MQIHEDMRFQKMIERMETLYMAGHTEEMKQLLEKLQTLAETEQDPIGLASAYFYRGLLFHNKPNDEAGMQYAKRALKIAQTQNIPYYEMKSSNSLGIMYSEASDFHTSLEYYLRAIHIADTHPEFCYASVLLNNVGNLFVWLEDYKEASIYLERAYSKGIVENKDDRELVSVIAANLVELYSHIENYEKVDEWKEKCYDFLTEEERVALDYVELINEARRCAQANKVEEVREKLQSFIQCTFDSSTYVYTFRCCINALKLGIELKDFELSAQLEEKLRFMQSESLMSSFSYDYALVRAEYYRAFYDYLPNEGNTFYDGYFKESQKRVKQLRNTYAKSLAVKIAYEDMKDENKNVHIQNELLQKDAEKDSFTNLYNKVSTEKYVRRALEARTSNTLQGLIVIDIDLFKRVNDNYGHGFGDKVIISVAKIVEAMDSEYKIVGRFGGDEFLLFLDRQKNIDEIKKLVEKLADKVASHIQLPDDRIEKITLSMGICIIDTEIDFEEAFSQADNALYQAKELGRNRYILNTEL